MVDTRVGIGGWRGHQGVGQTIEIGAAPDAAVAVTGTITLVNPGVGGYLTGTMCGQPAGATSSVNGAGGSVMANSLTVGAVARRQPLHHVVGRVAHPVRHDRVVDAVAAATTAWFTPFAHITQR